MQMELFDDQEKSILAAAPFPQVSEVPVSWGEINLQRADKYKAIVNPEIGKVYSIVSKDYKLIRHEDAVQRIESTIDENLELGKYKTVTEFYNDGGRMCRTYRFYKKSVEIKKGDKVNPELHLFNSYDITWPFIVLIGAFRFVCANGLVVGEKYLHFRKRHVFDFEQMDIKKQVSTALNRFNLQTNQWKRWTELKLTEKSYSNVMRTMKFGKKAKKEIKERTARKVEGYTDNGFPIINLWIFFNILTWYITHHAVSLNHRVEMEKRLRAAMRHFKRTKR
ncbi:MAG: hypothetical protein SRB2_02207 [Desulfobacteraceae bacterium Eth-SRB2]|nr:MAG: hypothetical protein SRB2_02207 [Desulfobacteraceae bacterium Eth-SRB2]